ncbi:MAG: cytochrome c [Pseudomonadota bacterium]|nr:cytochrome c [Pseudomonadota bacterium]
MFKKSSGNSVTRIRKRRLEGPRGGRTDSRRNLKLVIESEDDREETSNSEMLSGQIWNRLGSKGRFVAVSILIAIFMAASKIYYDRSQVDRLVFIDKTSRAQNSLGKELYQANCAFCHGDELQGQPHWDKTYIEGKRPAPPLNASGNIALLSNRELFEITKYGGQPFAPPHYINEMPAFEMLLKDSQIWAILAFLRAEF